MGKIDKNLKAAKSNLREEEEEEEEEEEDEIEDPQQLNPTMSPIELSSSTDDEGANEDLSLKIVQKAMLRACVAAQPKAEDSAVTVGVVDLTSSPSQEAGASPMAAADVKSRKKSRKEKKNKNKMVELAEETVVVAKEEEKADSSNPIEIIKVEVANPAEISNNIVLRKLLRGPRYFDPPDSGWGTCYNCGEEGHTTVNCTSAKRKKPCFVCGSLEHNAKQCTKGQDCFICNKRGHRAKECPEKYKRGSQNSKICLKCGDTAHDMFSCKNDYSSDDLKEIQCYICKSFGHLFCADFTDTGPSELSCYRCGQLGHGGMECTRSHGEAVSVGSVTSCFKCGGRGHFARECTSSAKECSRSHGEAVSVGSLTSCFKCGEGGHFARECTSSAKECTRSHGEAVSVGSVTSCFKCGEEGHFARECTSSAKVHKRKFEFLQVHKRKFELSTLTQKSPKKNRDAVRARSVSSEHGKAGKRKKAQYEGGFTTPSKSKRRGGWITEDLGELPYEKPMPHGWESPVTPKRRGGWVTEDPGDLPRGKAKVRRWESPLTPTNKRSQTYASVAGSQASSSRHSRKTQKLHFGASASASNGSSNFYQHRYSASRFGNSSSDGMRRNFDW